MYIKSVIQGLSSLSVNYVISDPFAEFGVVKLKVTRVQTGTQEIYDMAIDENQITLYDLKPDTQYLLTMYYINENGKSETMDELKVATIGSDVKVSISKVTQKKLNYTIRFDSSYSMSNINVSLYDSDGADLLDGSDGENEMSLGQLYNGIITGTITFPSFMPTDVVTVRMEADVNGAKIMAENSVEVPEQEEPSLANPIKTPEKPKETTAPETSVPETSVPETSVPETSVPETSAPETSPPETTVPETSPAETSAPETSAAETDEEPTAESKATPSISTP